MDKLKAFRRTIKKIMHRIRVGGAIILGTKTSKMSKLVESTLYELRLLTLVTFGILGFYIFEAAIDSPEKSTSEQFIIEMHIGILIIIIGLILIVVTKLNKSPQYHDHHTICENKNVHTRWIESPECHKTCKYINKNKLRR